ncbi:MAG: FtsX-like permease family protein [Candidatus Marinimicrobia bacterium]|nr:FtsX-like permease family protein [Candidatus Neomarinimicrobiota bacterium]
MLIQLAWKNIWRNKKRSLIILSAIAIGLTCGLFASAVMYGMWDTTIRNTIDKELGHYQLHSNEYKAENLIANYIPNGETVIDSLQMQPTTIAVSGRTIVEGIAASPTSSGGVRIIGIDPPDESKVTTLYQYMKQGAYLDTVKANTIIIGEKLAEKLNLKLNSKIVLSFQGLDESIVYSAFRIQGTFSSESSAFDETTVFVRQTDLFALLNHPIIFHEIAVRLDSDKELATIAGQNQQKFPGLKIETWRELAPELNMVNDMMSLYLNIFLGIILLALLFGITNIMLMSVLERVREFGMLMAVGMKRIKVFFLVIFEAIALSLVGGIIGIIFGSILTVIFAHVGIDLSIVSEGLSSFGVSSMLYPSLPWTIYPTLTFMIIVTAVISAILPARKAIRLKPSEAIRSF